jgi:hypothetical protein
MTSPATPGVIPPARARTMRVALYGRVACPDDPHTAIHRQLRAVSAALPTQARIIGYFADAGPCNGLRGSIRPTDTRHLDLDVIACSGTDWLSRQLAERLRIEDHLACHGIRVLTFDDPAITTLGTVLSAPRPGAAPPSLSDRQVPGAADGRGGAW